MRTYLEWALTSLWRTGHLTSRTEYDEMVDNLIADVTVKRIAIFSDGSKREEILTGRLIRERAPEFLPVVRKKLEALIRQYLRSGELPDVTVVELESIARRPTPASSGVGRRLIAVLVWVLAVLAWILLVYLIWDMSQGHTGPLLPPPSPLPSASQSV